MCATSTLLTEPGGSTEHAWLVGLSQSLPAGHRTSSLGLQSYERVDHESSALFFLSRLLVAPSLWDAEERRMTIKGMCNDVGEQDGSQG